MIRSPDKLKKDFKQNLKMIQQTPVESCVMQHKNVIYILFFLTWYHWKKIYVVGLISFVAFILNEKSLYRRKKGSRKSPFNNFTIFFIFFPSKISNAV